MGRRGRLITWNNYLDLILPPTNRVRIGLNKINDLENAIGLQATIHEMLRLTHLSYDFPLMNALYVGDPHVSYQNSTLPKFKLENLTQEVQDKIFYLKRKIDRFLIDIPLNHDKVLLIDLCRVAVRDDLFPPSLIQAVGKQDFSSYHDTSSAFAYVSSIVKPVTKDLFRDIHFKPWREKNEKEFLRQKRKEEKVNHEYQKPYLDYLDSEESQMFDDFWEMHQWENVAAFLSGEKSNSDDELDEYVTYFQSWHQELLEGAHPALPWRKAYLTLQKYVEGIPSEYRIVYLQTLRGYQELKHPLWIYRNLRNGKNLPLEKHLATAFYSTYGFGYGRSQAFRQAASKVQFSNSFRHTLFWFRTIHKVLHLI